MKLPKHFLGSQVNFILVIAAGLFLASVVHTSPAGSWPTVTVDGISYVPLNSLSDSSGFLYRWDPLLKNAMVSGSKGAIKFHIGSEYILDGGNIVKLDGKVRILNGSVLAPLSVEPYLTGLMGEKTFVPTHRIRKIVIDAGHGGQDFGAISPWGVKEKDLTLQIANQIRERLERAGLQVVMTRDADVYVPLSERAYTTNKEKADLFVSVHANASSANSLKGFEVYYLSEAVDDVALAVSRSEDASGELQAVLWDLKESENRRQSIRVANAVTAAVQHAVEISNSRIRAAKFYVLKWTDCPSVLVETGYLTNREDEKRLESGTYQEDLAQGVARGILDYKDEFEKTDGFTR